MTTPGGMKTTRKPLQTLELDNLGPWYTLEAGARKLDLTPAAVYEGIRRYGLTTVRLGRKTLLFQPTEYGRAARAARELANERRRERANGRQRDAA